MNTLRKAVTLPEPEPVIDLLSPQLVHTSYSFEGSSITLNCLGGLSGSSTRRCVLDPAGALPAAAFAAFCFVILCLLCASYKV